MNAFHAWQLLLVALAGWMNRHQQNVIAYIHEENRILKALIVELQQRFPSQLSLYRYYLDRHVHLDEEHHGPMAMRMQ